jgi:hypothetical protein
VRRGLGIAVALLGFAAVLYLAYRHGRTRPALRDGFERVTAGMSDEQVRGVLGPPGNYQSDWRTLVSDYAEVWQIRDGRFARREYRGIAVHTEVGFSGSWFRVWTTDEAVVLVEFDGDDRVCGKIWLAEQAPAGSTTAGSRDAEVVDGAEKAGPTRHDP